jgi:hypothetical protein
MNPYQLAAIQGQANQAMQGTPLTDMGQQAVAGQIAGVQNPTYGFLSGAMGDPYAGAGQGMPWAQQAGMNAFGANPAMGMMAQEASGGNLGNPYLQDMYQSGIRGIQDAFSETTMPNMSSMFSRAGGTGGSTQALQVGRAQEGLANQLGDYTSSFLGNQYNQDRNRQTNAMQALGSNWLGGLGAQQGAAGQIGQLGQAALGGQMGAAGQLGGQFQADLGRQLQASQMAPGMEQAGYNNYGMLGQAGGQLQGQQQAQLSAEQQRWQEAMYGPGAPQNWLSNYANLTYPAAGFGGVQNASGPGTSTAGNALAGGLGGASMGAMTGGAMTGFPMAAPYGAAIGGGLGLLGGMYG